MIKLSCGYVIEPDTYGYTLGIPTTIKVTNKETDVVEDKPAWKDQTFHSTIGGALRSYRKRRQRKMIAESDYTIATLMDALKALDAQIFAEAREVGFEPIREGEK